MRAETAASKVPAVTLGFWLIKILATTLGETGGDTVSMTLDLGYLAGSAIFLAVLVVLASLQIAAVRFRPWLYWATIIASTTAMLLLACVQLTLLAWHRSVGAISADDITQPRAEMFYWVTITFSQTLGTALGDWVADSGLGYAGAALVFAAALAAIAILHFRSSVSRTMLFWAAFITTRPSTECRCPVIESVYSTPVT